MPGRVDSDTELEEEKKDKKKSRQRSRSREKKKSKKHRKEKKRRRRSSGGSAGDTGGEGGDTPGKKDRSATPPVSAKLPGIARYDSEGSDEEMEEKRREYKREGEKEKKDVEKERERDREKRGERRSKKKRSRTRSRSRNRRSRSRERRDKRDGKDGREDKDRGRYRREEEKKDEGGEEEDTNFGNKEVLSLSIEETNKLREKLGLKPLNVSDKYNPEDAEEEEDGTKAGTLIPGDRDKTRHLPADHWGEKAKSEKLREKLALKKEKRSIESKLAAVRGLADSDSDDDTAKWVQKQKSKLQAKEEADKRAKELLELDDEFGVGELVTEKLKQDQGSKYTARDLRGLRVEHSTEHFGDNTTILTLKDQDILDEKYEDVLVNVNIMDTERTKKNLENIKSHAGYQAYDQEDVDELTGEVTRKGILYQYNEEIDGAKKESFTLESSGKFSEEENKARELAKIRQKLKLGSVQSLVTPELRLASDYYNEDEMASFKKPKSKKKKIRKKILKADDLLKMTAPETLLPTNFGNAKKKRAARIIDDDEELPDGRLPQTYDDLPVVEDLTGVRVEEDDGGFIRNRLNKAMKLKNKKGMSSLDEISASIISDRDPREPEEEREYSDLILDQTQEFCRNLGEVVTFETSGLGEGVSTELLDFEHSLIAEKKKEPKAKRSSRGKLTTGGWEEVGDKMEDDMEVDDEDENMDSEHKQNSGGKSRPTILDDEALASTGMGAALKMAEQMGYLDRKEQGKKEAGLQDLIAKKYSVEDKTRDYEEDDRKRRRGDRSSYSGPTSSFTEKRGYKPEINLEYLDDGGRKLSSKEAFRFLSHKFHGKSSGKIKTEKRQRKVAEDKLMQKMSSVDTPLQTLAKQQEKTRELATPYLVLSGNKQLSRLKK